MTYVYILFGILGVIAECSDKINTSNLFKKLGLFLIIIGSILELADKQTNMLIAGAFLYIAIDIVTTLGQKYGNKDNN